MNNAADQWPKDNDSHEKKRRGIFRRMAARPLFALGWIAAGIALIFLAAFVFYPHRKTPMSLLKNLMPGPKVFRAKLSENLKVAQNLFRQKIPPSDHPVQSITKVDIIPTVEKKTEPSQPTFDLPEKQEPLKASEPHRPLQPQTQIEIPITVAEKTISSQPAVGPSAKRESPKETELHEPSQLQTKTETPIPVEEKTISSQPAVVPPEKQESLEETELHEPIESQIKIEATPPLEEKSEERSIRSEKWILSQKSSYYTIQLMGARNDALLFDFVEKNQLLEQNEIAFYQTTFKDKPWFQLLYGVYVTQKDALAAADNLSPKMRTSSPWIRRLSAVQKAIRNKAAQ